MSDAENRRETGARKLSSRPDQQGGEAISRQAAKNRPPKNGMGLTTGTDRTPEELGQSDGRGRIAGRVPSLPLADDDVSGDRRPAKGSPD